MSADITTPKWDINHTVIDVAPSGLLTLQYRDMVIFEIQKYLVCNYLWQQRNRLLTARQHVNAALWSHIVYVPDPTRRCCPLLTSYHDMYDIIL